MSRGKFVNYTLSYFYNFIIMVSSYRLLLEGQKRVVLLDEDSIHVPELDSR